MDTVIAVAAVCLAFGAVLGGLWLVASGNVSDGSALVTVGSGAAVAGGVVTVRAE